MPRRTTAAGFCCLQLDRSEEALASCDKAIALKSGNAEIHFNRGAALKGLKQLDEAIASYDKAIAEREFSHFALRQYR